MSYLEETLAYLEKIQYCGYSPTNANPSFGCVSCNARRGELHEDGCEMPKIQQKLKDAIQEQKETKVTATPKGGEASTKK